MMDVLGYLIFFLGLAVVGFAIWATNNPSARERQRAIYREVQCGCRHAMPHGQPDRRCRLCNGHGSYLRRVR